MQPKFNYLIRDLNIAEIKAEGFLPDCKKGTFCKEMLRLLFKATVKTSLAFILNWIYVLL
jgi:hypothetical protein